MGEIGVTVRVVDIFGWTFPRYGDGGVWDKVVRRKYHELGMSKVRFNFMNVHRTYPHFPPMNCVDQSVRDNTK